MRTRKQRVLALAVVAAFAVFGLVFFAGPDQSKTVTAQEKEKKPAVAAEQDFDMEAALADLRKKIEGRENEPAEDVFKNIRSFEGVPAGRFLAIMRFGYARSLGVDCTHCHVPGKWALEDKPTKQIARDMKDMAAKINADLLKNMKSLGERQAVVNCTTCHRGEIKPALNLPMPAAPAKPAEKAKGDRSSV